MINSNIQTQKKLIKPVAGIAGAIIWEWNVMADTMWANENFTTAFGYDAIESANEFWKNNIHPDDKERIANSIRRAIADKEKNWQAEYRFLKQNGSYAAVHNTADCIIEGGSVTRMIGALTELADQKQPEMEEWMRFALDAAELGTWSFYPATGIINWNDRCRQLNGFAGGEETMYESVIANIHPDDVKLVKKAVARSLDPAIRADYSTEIRITGAENKIERWIRTKGKAYFHKNGTVKRLSGIAQDITKEINDRKDQEMMDNSVGLMSVLGMDKKNSYIDKAGKKILGIDEDADVSQIPISDFHTTEQIEFVGREILPNVMSKGSWPGRFAAKHIKTGEITPLENNCLRIEDIITGKPIAIGAVMRNLRPEMEAQQEQWRLLFLLENISDFVSLSDVEGNVSYVNAAGMKLLGLTDAGEVKRHNSHYIMPGEGERLKNEINKQLFERGSWSGEVLYRHFITGEPVLVQGTTMIVNDPITGLPQGRATIARDIRAERAAQKALMESENLFRSIATAMPLILWMSDTKGKITYINQRWTEFVGLPEQPFDGEVWHNAILEEDRETLLQSYAHAMQNATTLSIGYRVKRTDGKITWTYTLGKPQYNEAGTYTGFLGYTTDITEQKKLQRQKDEFIGIASHELKTPVTSLKIYTHLLESMFRQNGANAEAEMLGKMDVQINKLSNLISDLLDVTKIQAGKLQFNDAVFNFNKLADDIVEDLQRTTRKHIIIKKFAAAGSVFGDEHRIGQVMTNFITNAIKYSPDATEIIVYISRTKKEVTLCVQDYGIGIAKDKQERVFEQFYRVTGGRQATFPGLGLGLYISAEIIKREGGKIWVESTEGEGSSFSFSLPVNDRKFDD